MPGVILIPVQQEQPAATVDLFSTAVDATGIPAAVDALAFAAIVGIGCTIPVAASILLDFTSKISEETADKIAVWLAIATLAVPIVAFSPWHSNYGQLFWNMWSTTPIVAVDSDADTDLRDEPSLMASTRTDFAHAIQDSDSPFIEGLDAACDSLKKTADNPDNLSVLCGGYSADSVNTQTSRLVPHIETLDKSDPSQVEIRGEIRVYNRSK